MTRICERCSTFCVELFTQSDSTDRGHHRGIRQSTTYEILLDDLLQQASHCEICHFLWPYLVAKHRVRIVGREIIVMLTWYLQNAGGVCQRLHIAYDMYRRDEGAMTRPAKDTWERCKVGFRNAIKKHVFSESDSDDRWLDKVPARYMGLLFSGVFRLQISYPPFSYNGNLQVFDSEPTYNYIQECIKNCRCFKEYDNDLKITSIFPERSGDDTLGARLSHDYLLHRSLPGIPYREDIPSTLEALFGTGPVTNLPTRVLEVIGDAKMNPAFVRLIHTSPRDSSRYIALSYCWGGPQPITTTRATLSELSYPFSVSSLPQTIQDAIHVTRRLGFSYLWVDALCIVQDDDEDKAKEISRMADIYSMAYITISAATSSACTTGFLNQPINDGLQIKAYLSPKRFDLVFLHPKSFQPVECVLQPYKEQAEISETEEAIRGYIFGFRDALEEEERKEKDPIHTRGWTMQESALSRRLIYFSRQGVAWQCGCMKSSRGTIQKIRSLHQPRICEDLIYEWMDVIDEYSTRQLTMDSDKFHAIAGIAEKFSQVPSYFDHKEDAAVAEKRVIMATSDYLGQYLAGHWQRDFTEQLAWKVLPKSSLLPSNREKDHSLSWSWVSAKGPLEMSSTRIRRDLPGKNSYRDRASLHAFAQPLSCSVTLQLDFMPYGKVIAGSLRLFAQCRSVASIPREPLQRFLTAALIFMDHGGSASSSELQDLWVLSLPMETFTMIYRHYPVRDIPGLILQKTASGEFIRVGMYESPDNDIGIQLWPQDDALCSSIYEQFQPPPRGSSDRYPVPEPASGLRILRSEASIQEEYKRSVFDTMTAPGSVLRRTRGVHPRWDTDNSDPRIAPTWKHLAGYREVVIL